MKCPVCSLELIVVERNGIELDYCIQCQGFWFDAGEINLPLTTLYRVRRTLDCSWEALLGK